DAVKCPGVRPNIALAASPTATTCPVFWFTATTDGSLTTMPLPRKYTSVLAVPRSMPTSFDTKGKNLLVKNLGIGSQSAKQFVDGFMLYLSGFAIDTFVLTSGKCLFRYHDAQRDAKRSEEHTSELQSRQ